MDVGDRESNEGCGKWFFVFYDAITHFSDQVREKS